MNNLIDIKLQHETLMYLQIINIKVKPYWQYICSIHERILAYIKLELHLLQIICKSIIELLINNIIIILNLSFKIKIIIFKKLIINIIDFYCRIMIMIKLLKPAKKKTEFLYFMRVHQTSIIRGL